MKKDSYIKQWLEDFWGIFTHELKLIFSDSGVMVIFFLAGLAYPILYNFMYLNGVLSETPIAVVDNADCSASRRFAREVDATRECAVRYHCVNVNEAQDLMKEGKIRGYLYFPADYGEKLARLETATLSAYADMSSFLYYKNILMGGCSIDAYGVPLTDEALEVAKNSDAVLLGSIGGDTNTSPWYKLDPTLRPEAGLLKIRKELGLFANLRPAYLYKELAGACPLKESTSEAGFDMIIVRELTGGLYFGERNTKEINGELVAHDNLVYSEHEIRRIAQRGFEIAMKRGKKLTSVDKANVLDTSRLWRKIVNEVAQDFPEVKVEHMLVDNCAMQLVKDPAQFDVVLTENMFGDILSDEASMVTGSIGMLSSASLREDSLGMYEPSHGSAPDIAGQNIANPLATILSAAMMLRYSFDMDEEAACIEKAVEKVLADHIRTVDIYKEGMTKVSTSQMGDAVVERL